MSRSLINSPGFRRRRSTQPSLCDALGGDALGNVRRQRTTGHLQVVVRLQVLPELRRPAEEEPEAQRRVGSDAAAVVDHLGDPVWRDVQRPRQRSLR
jgi:hypothetical protein